MSARVARGRLRGLLGGADLRWPALAGIALLTLSYVSVLYRVTDVVGASVLMVALVAGTLAAATLLGGVLRPRAALLLTLLLVALGGVAYFAAVPESRLALLTAESLTTDAVALLTGLSILRLVAAHVWALGIAPGPVFLSWYLAVRGRYAASALVGGLALGLVVLTGDAGTLATLAGVVGALAAVGFGTLDRHGATTAQFDTLAATVAAAVVLTATLSVVPGGAVSPLAGGSSGTLEASLVDDDGRVSVLGSISLSPKVRFTVDSTEEARWRVAGYDRYTGQGWVRTGESVPYDGRLAGPPGDARRVEQTVTAETPLDVLPAAWRPTSVEGDVARTARVTEQRGLQPGRTVEAGETYRVTSLAPAYAVEDLRGAGTDYPEGLRAAYTQLPDSTPDRVQRRAEEIAGDEPTPYAKAVAVERYLEENKRYSLEVERPSGDIADGFLFRMDAGYCTYFATTMVTLLRSQGVPARFVTGYTPGQEVDDGRYVVRGLDAHAWVEVYFPAVGWVAFDPTPTGPRERAEQQRLRSAREGGTGGVDTSQSEPEAESLVNESEFNDTTTGNVTLTPAADELGGSTDVETGGGGFDPRLPSRRTLGLGLVALIGIAAGARRAGATREVRRRVREYYQPRREPEADAVRAYERVEAVLAREFRPRAPGETVREYVAALPYAESGVERVAETYERARFGGGVTAEEARAAVEAADAVTRRRLPLVGDYWR